jgi:SH2 domain-containing protein 4A
VCAGLITRQEAEQLLADCQPGTFLVRLSDRVWGYAVSYKGLQGGYKHYLIDAAGPQYHFFGDNQLPFNSLAELIAAYKVL